MNWNKGLALLVLLAAVGGALWLSRSSLDPAARPSPDVNTFAAPREAADTPGGAPAKRPWEGVKPPRIAGPPVFPPRPTPQDLQVEWHGSWFPAEILSSIASSNLIRYKGYGPEWDEWVGSERMRYVSADQAADLPSGSPVVVSFPLHEAGPVGSDVTPDLVVHGSPGKGDLLVQWGRGWWPAEVLESQGTNHLVRYKGYGAEWDEWVTAERMGLYEGDEP